MCVRVYVVCVHGRGCVRVGMCACVCTWCVRVGVVYVHVYGCVCMGVCVCVCTDLGVYACVLGCVLAARQTCLTAQW